MDDTKAVFVASVRRHEGLPEALTANAERVTNLEQTAFDQTYLDFLDEQIELCPRGPEWNDRLKCRRDALAPFCNRDLLRGTIETDGTTFSIRVDPVEQIVVHWEEYEEASQQ